MRSRASTSLRDDDDLGEGLVRQLRVEAEPEAGRALADIGRVGGDVLVALDHRLGLARGLGRHADRGAFGQAHLEEQFRPLRKREELLLHPAETDHRGGEDADRRQDDDDAVAHAPVDHPAQRIVEARLVDLVRIVMRGGDLGEVGQQLHAEIGREHDRHEPARDQRDGDDPEDAAGIFPDRRIGEADRQEAGRRHQRAGQHREGGRGPGKGGGALAVPALLHLHHHHLDGDDGVVDEQAERDDERAERDPVQIEVDDAHRR